MSKYSEPISKYSAPLWNNVGVLLWRDFERLLRCFTKRLYELRSMPNEDRFVKLQLDSLKDRRKHTELIIAFKTLLTTIDNYRPTHHQ